MKKNEMIRRLAEKLNEAEERLKTAELTCEYLRSRVAELNGACTQLKESLNDAFTKLKESTAGQAPPEDNPSEQAKHVIRLKQDLDYARRRIDILENANRGLSEECGRLSGVPTSQSSSSLPE